MNNDWIEPVGLIAAVGFMVYLVFAAAFFDLFRARFARIGMWRMRLLVFSLTWPIWAAVIIGLWLLRLLATGFSCWHTRLNDAWGIFETTVDARPQLILRDARKAPLDS